MLSKEERKKEKKARKRAQKELELREIDQNDSSSHSTPVSLDALASTQAGVTDENEKRDEIKKRKMSKKEKKLAKVADRSQ